MNRLSKNSPSNREYFIKVFVFGLIISILIFAPYMILDNGYFLYYGDYNSQEVPFYQLMHDAVLKGDIFWNWETDLGSNTIGSYSFYMLGSPFFWLTLPFPSKAVPYLMGPLLMLKFAFASLTGYIYLKRYVRTQNFAVIGGLLYAFSGYQIYNIFFNHFHEVTVIFPLLLAAIDEYMYTKRRGVVALTVFAAALINYYFFVAEVIFAAIYWIVRMVFKSWKITFKEFLWLAFECIIGFGASAVMFLPAILSAIQNPRVDNLPKGWDIFFHNPKSRYVHILQSIFFPPDIPARPNFTPDSNAKWASLGAWLPLFGTTGVFAWITARKRHWLTFILAALLFISSVPILNSSFQLFNNMFYTRWFFGLTLMMSLATILALDMKKSRWRIGILCTLIITLCIALPIGFLPKEVGEREERQIKFGIMEYPDRFWIYIAIALISILIITLIMNNFCSNKKHFFSILIISLTGIILIYSSYIIYLGKSLVTDAHSFIIPYALNGKESINLPDEEDCRMDTYGVMDNMSCFWQIPGIQTFHTVVPGSIMEFYPSIGVERGVGSRPGVGVYGLRSLVSCRWLFDFTEDKNDFNDPGKGTLMPGWSYYANKNGFDIWQNESYIPFGFTYNNYIPKEQYESVNLQNRHLLLLKAIVLDEDQIKRHNDILAPIDLSSVQYTQDEYFEDCVNRNEITCHSFSRDRRGFIAEITLDDTSDRLIFFSVPFEDGWSAEVNGEAAKIEKVNVGFMAVRVPKGTVSTIRFNYMTPGLIYGLAISIVCLLILAVYILISALNGKLKPKLVNKFYKPSTADDKKLLLSYKTNKMEILNDVIDHECHSEYNNENTDNGEDI